MRREGGLHRDDAADEALGRREKWADGFWGQRSGGDFLLIIEKKSVSLQYETGEDYGCKES